MGDMGEVFRDMKAAKAERKATSLKENLDILNELNLDYEVHNHGYQLNFTTSFGIVAFYPSTNRLLNRWRFFMEHYLAYNGERWKLFLDCAQQPFDTMPSASDRLDQHFYFWRKLRDI